LSGISGDILSVYDTIFFPLILVVNNVRKTVVKFLDRENTLKILFSVENMRYFHVEIVPEIARPKCPMIYVCDVTVFDKQTNMAESEGKRSGSKICVTS